MDSNQDGRILFDEFIECLEAGTRGLTPMLQSLVPAQGGAAAAAPAPAAAANDSAGAARAAAEGGDVSEPPSKRSK